MPSATVPVMVYQNVEVPFVARTCPCVPVALLESRSSPVRRSLAIVDEARDAVAAVNSVAVVVASVVRPVLVRDDVAVIEPPVIVPPVILVKNEVMPLMTEAMRPVVVVVLVTVSDDAVVVARFVVPLTVSAVADALPKEDVPEMRVENVPVVNVGLGASEMVEVPVNTMLDPALKYAIGEL